jgi:hypothetical protein
MNFRSAEFEQSEPPRIPLISLLNSQLPTALIKNHNPLFDRQLWLLRWPDIRISRWSTTSSISDFIRSATTAAISRFTVRYALIFPIVFGIFVAFLIFPSFRYQYSAFPNLLLGTLGFSCLCDLYYAVTTINGISHQMVTEQWDSLRLTLLTKEDILLANYATAQIRAWRLVIVEVGIRVIFCLSLVLIGIASVRLTADSLDNLIQGGLILGILAIGYILEPLWRMRTVTLLSMTMTTWMNNYATVIAVSFAALIGLLLLQAGVLFGVVRFFDSLFLNSYPDFGKQVIAISSLVGAIYLYFRVVRGALFRLLKRVAFRG